MFVIQEEICLQQLNKDLMKNMVSINMYINFGHLFSLVLNV